MPRTACTFWTSQLQKVLRTLSVFYSVWLRNELRATAFSTSVVREKWLQLHYTALHYKLDYSTLHYTTLYYSPLHYTIHQLHCTTSHYIALHHTTIHYNNYNYMAEVEAMYGTIKAYHWKIDRHKETKHDQIWWRDFLIHVIFLSLTVGLGGKSPEYVTIPDGRYINNVCTYSV